MVDEAHALGVLGATGRGIAEHFGIDPATVDIWMGTLSKTLVELRRLHRRPAALIEFLKFTAPGFVYSVGIPPPAAVAALAALDLLKEERRPGRAAAGQRPAVPRSARAPPASTWARSAGFAVVPVIIGDSLRTVMLAQRLLERGVNAVPIIPPGVQEQGARLRFFVCAGHTPEQIEQAVALMRDELAALEQQGVSLANIAELAVRPATSGCVELSAAAFPRGFGTSGRRWRGTGQPARTHWREPAARAARETRSSSVGARSRA